MWHWLNALGFCAALLFSPLLSAEIYKWVDENGKVHFGDRPKSAGADNAEQIQLRENSPGQSSNPTQQRNAAQRRERMLRVYEEERAKKREKKAKEKAERAERKRRCNYAKNQLKDARHSVLYDLDEDGNRVYLDNRQRKSHLAKLEQEVGRWCD
jgi:flagellar biosynthesis GTPase FlhF